MIKTAIETGEFGASQGGSVSLVGAGPGAKDLITLRGVQRLQEQMSFIMTAFLIPKSLNWRAVTLNVFMSAKPRAVTVGRRKRSLKHWSLPPNAGNVLSV